MRTKVTSISWSRDSVYAGPDQADVGVTGVSGEGLVALLLVEIPHSFCRASDVASSLSFWSVVVLFRRRSSVDVSPAKARKCPNLKFLSF